MDPSNPVPGFEVHDENINGARFSEYITDRELPDLVTHDLIDRASIHNARYSCLSTGKMTVEEAYEHCGIIPDKIPTATPQFNPVEQLFSYLQKYVERRAIDLNKNGAGWSKDDLVDILYEARETVIDELVKSWYRNSYGLMFPEKAIPKFLR